MTDVIKIQNWNFPDKKPFISGRQEAPKNKWAATQIVWKVVEQALQLDRSHCLHN